MKEIDLTSSKKSFKSSLLTKTTKRSKAITVFTILFILFMVAYPQTLYIGGVAIPEPQSYLDSLRRENLTRLSLIEQHVIQLYDSTQQPAQ